MGALQRAQDRVSLPESHETLAVVVKRDDSGDLGQRCLFPGVIAQLQLDRHRTIGLRLAQHRAGVAAAAVDWEGHPHAAVERGRVALVGPEPEPGRRLEREWPSRLELAHRSRAAAIPEIVCSP